MEWNVRRYRHTMSDSEVALLMSDLQAGVQANARDSSQGYSEPTAEDKAFFETTKFFRIVRPKLKVFIEQISLKDSVEEGVIEKWLENYKILRMVSRRCKFKEDWYALLALSYRICCGGVFTVVAAKKFTELVAPELQAAG